MAARLPASPPHIWKAPRRPLFRQAPSGGQHRYFTLTQRPTAPAHWHNIAPILRRENPAEDKNRTRLWQLVLEAKSLPFRFFRKGPRSSLFVPPVAALAALHEILAFEREKPPLPPPSPPDRQGTYWYIALLAALAPWHRIRWQTLLPFTSWPTSPQDWLTVAGLDAYRVTAMHEWWRAVTALTLHADDAHLVANLVAGAVFALPLCRYTGVGFGFFLTALAGCIGNIATAYLRPATFLSQGFSTAVFASAGLLAAFAAAFAARHAYATAKATHHREAGKDALWQGFLKGLPPIGAGIGFLAMLGGSGAPNVDYLAHCMGLFAGILLGLGVALPALPHLSPRSRGNALLQGISLFTAISLFIVAWRMALNT